MAKPRKKIIPEFTRYTIGNDDRVKYKGRQFRLSKTDGELVVLRSIEEDLTAKIEAFRIDDLDRMIRLKIIEVDVGYFTDANVMARARNVPIFDLPPDIILRARMLSEFLEAELDIHETGEKVTRSDRSIATFIAKFDEENQDMVKKPRGGQKERSYRERKIIGPRQFRRLLKRFEEGGLHPTALIPRYQGRQSMESTFTVEEQEYFQSFALKYQTEDRLSMKACYEQMEADNEQRPSKGLKSIRLLSLRSFQRIVNDLGDFDNEYFRAGNKYRVERKYGLAGKGLRVKFPLEIAEMDEHKIDLVRILIRNGIWAELHPDVKKKIAEKGRPWLSVAMDAYSRSILGMRLLWDEPSGQSAIETLAMAVRNKDTETALYGTLTGWPQCGRPRAVHTDAGAGYIDSGFQAAVMALTDKHVIPPAKHPHLRGRVERFFRTINQRYIGLFSGGQTFSNVILRDQYDSVKHAHMHHEELAYLLVRLIVDCYHNTVQKGLMGLTPLEAWYRGSQIEGEVQPPPSDEEYRDIFGISMTRHIENTGIEILGNKYASRELEKLRKKHLNIQPQIRVNPLDISEISVKHPVDGWFSVKATYDGLKGVSIDDWAETVRYIKLHFGKRSKVSYSAVTSTLREVVEAGKLSRDRHGIGAPQHTAATIAMLEKKMLANISFSQPREIDFGKTGEATTTDAAIESSAESLLPEDGVYGRPASFPSLDEGQHEAAPVAPRETRTTRAKDTNQTDADDEISVDDEDDDVEVVFEPIQTEKRNRRDD